MNNLTDYLHHSHQCSCGSGLIPNWYKNEKQKEEKACEKCKHKLLYKILDDKFLDIFEKWLPEIMFNKTAPLSYEYQWQDLLKEKNMIRSQEIIHKPNHICVECPEDKEFHIYIPNDLAEQILINGKMI